MLKHILTITGILILVSVVYMRIPGTYFCGYDDFLEVHRAAFEDTENPAHVYTTTHFDSYKYRPLNRALNLWTYWWGDGDASYFRTRNVAFHLLNVVLVYALAWLLFRSFRVSLIAALLFGVHPLSNQAVVGSVMTNTAAHALLLFSILSFLLSLRRSWAWPIWLSLSLLAGLAGTLTYEAGIIVYPMLLSYLILHRLLTKERLVSWRYMLVVTVGSIVCMASYFYFRSLFVPYSARQAVPSIKTMIKSAVMYAASFVIPVDWVMTNEWFNTPLPSQLSLQRIGFVWLALMLFLFMLAAIAALVAIVKFVKRVPRTALPNVLFLLVSIAAVISPLIILTDKPSETYLYLPIAFAAIFFAIFLVTLIQSGKSLQRYGFALTIVLAILFASGTWVRNTRVRRCGDTARHIVTSLQQDKMKDGLWFLWLSADPTQTLSTRYGMYGWSNVYTLGETGVQPAAQLVNKNKQLAATVVEPGFFEKNCHNSRYICLSVRNDGAVAQVSSVAQTGSKPSQ